MQNWGNKKGRPDQSTTIYQQKAEASMRHLVAKDCWEEPSWNRWKQPAKKKKMLCDELQKININWKERKRSSHDGVVWRQTRLAQRISCLALQRLSAALPGHDWPRPLLLDYLQRGDSQVCKCINAPFSHLLICLGQSSNHITKEPPNLEHIDWRNVNFMTKLWCIHRNAPTTICSWGAHALQGRNARKHGGIKSSQFPL